MSEKLDPKLQRMVDLSNAYKKVFSGPDGELVLYDILNQGHLLTPLRATSKSKEDILIAEGRRELAIAISNMVEKDTKAVMKSFRSEEEDEKKYYNSITE